MAEVSLVELLSLDHILFQVFVWCRQIRIYYVSQTPEIYLALSYSMDFKVPGSFEIHWVRQYLVNVVLFQTNDL